MSVFSFFSKNRNQKKTDSQNVIGIIQSKSDSRVFQKIGSGDIIDRREALEKFVDDDLVDGLDFLTAVPGIDKKRASLLLKNANVTNIWQLMGHFLLLKQNGMSSRDHTEAFWHWLESKIGKGACGKCLTGKVCNPDSRRCVNAKGKIGLALDTDAINIQDIVQALQEKLEIKFPSLYTNE